MPKRSWFVALALSFSITTGTLAQTQVATVTSNSPFELRGATVKPSLAVPDWPVMPGDKIKAGNQPATLTFPDGSSIVLAPCAAATVGLADNTPVFQLDSESAKYTLARLDGVKLRSKDDAVAPSALVGNLSISSTCTPAGFWTPARTALIVAAAAGLAGVTVGLVTQNGAPVSPSR